MRMNRAIDGFCRLLEILIAVFLAVMVVMVFGNVVLRYGFNSGITVSEELSRWLFVWMIFLGAIVALRRRAHLGMDSIVQMLPTAGRKACFALSHLLMLYCVWLFFEGSWQQTVINLDVRAPATGLSSGFFYGVGLVFCVSAAGVLASNLYRLFRGRVDVDELIQVKESEEGGEASRMRDDITREPAA